MNMRKDLQPTINIGTLGHVANGKSSTIRALTGVQTSKFKVEMSRNITMKLGYANCKIYKCNRCPRPECYKSTSSDVMTLVCSCGETMSLERHISFVDLPGHNSLMSQVLNGNSVMDGAVLLVAANESFPQPQTLEHIAITEISNLKNLIVLQNKVDLVKETDCCIQYEKIREFMKDTKNPDSSIIPMSAQLGYNIDVLCEYLVKKIPEPVRDLESTPRMIIVRSFDVNKPGDKVKELKGGVCGGSIVRGVFNVGDEIEIRPGISRRDENGKLKCMPIYSKIISLFSEENSLQSAIPGGLIGVGLQIDPVLTKGDYMVGHIMGRKGTLPGIFLEIEINFFLMKKVVGLELDEKENKDNKTKKLIDGEVLMININSMSTGGKVVGIKNDLAKISLTNPICADVGDKVALSRRINKQFRLIGYGKIKSGIEAEIDDNLQFSDYDNSYV